jgi:signal recognition particle subunit SRP54
VSLVEEAQEKIDKQEAQRVAERMFVKSFNLDDMLAQLEQVQRMGSLKDLVKKLPGQFAEALGEQELDDRLLARQKAILQSMTPYERINPEEIHAQRRQRVARGSGTSVNDVNELLKSFKQMKKQMKEIKGTLMGRMGARQMEKRKEKILKEMKKGRIPGLPGM